MSFRLPALKSLGELSAREPVIVIDTHEIQPLSFQRLQTVRGTLTTEIIRLLAWRISLPWNARR